MLQSIVRFVLGVLFTWLVATGVVTQSQVDSDLPTIVEVVVMGLLMAGSILWSYLEKLYKGHITATGQTIPNPPPAVINFPPPAPTNPSLPPNQTSVERPPAATPPKNP